MPKNAIGCVIYQPKQLFSLKVVKTEYTNGIIQFNDVNSFKNFSPLMIKFNVYSLLFNSQNYEIVSFSFNLCHKKIKN